MTDFVIVLIEMISEKGLIFPSFQTVVQTFTHNSITSDLMQGTEII